MFCFRTQRYEPGGEKRIKEEMQEQNEELKKRIDDLIASNQSKKKLQVEVPNEVRVSFEILSLIFYCAMNVFINLKKFHLALQKINPSFFFAKLISSTLIH